MTADGDRAEIEATGPRRRVVVGIDGSAAGQRALDWAIADVVAHDGVLDLVTAWMYPSVSGYAFTTTVQEVHTASQNLLDVAIAYVAEVAPTVVVRGETTEQAPGPALVKAGQGADLLVVGSRGLGGFADLLVGSVSLYCVRHATCSVTVVRPG